MRSCRKNSAESPDATDCSDNTPKKTSSLSLARMIDHTLLQASATPADIAVLCREAFEYGFFSVCVNGQYASYAREVLDGLARAENSRSHVKVCCVVGFPLGANSTAVKSFEAEDCLRSGAEEIDMVLAVGKLCGGDTAYVLRDICAVVSVCKQHHAVCKVILETALLTQAQIETASHLAIQAGADFIKTSTGFSTRGASLEDVVLMHKLAAPNDVQVKASGGICSREDAENMIQAGASRLGSSSGVKIFCGETNL